MKKNGFTLVEMLLVIALIATITAIIIPNITSSIETGHAKEYESYVKLLEDNLEMYKTDLNVKDNKTVSIGDLRSRVSELKYDEEKCTINELKIQKETAGFTYCAKITCDGKEYKSKTCK